MESRNEPSCSIARRCLWSLENTFVLLGALIVYRFSSEFDSVIAVLLRGVKTSGEIVNPPVNLLWYPLKAMQHIVIAVMVCSCCDIRSLSSCQLPAAMPQSTSFHYVPWWVFSLTSLFWAEISFVLENWSSIHATLRFSFFFPRNPFNLHRFSRYSTVSWHDQRRQGFASVTVTFCIPKSTPQAVDRCSRYNLNWSGHPQRCVRKLLSRRTPWKYSILEDVFLLKSVTILHCLVAVENITDVLNILVLKSPPSRYLN